MLNGQLLSNYFVKPVIMSQSIINSLKIVRLLSASPSKEPLICNVFRVKMMFCASPSYDWLTMYGTCYFFSTKEKGDPAILANCNTSVFVFIQKKNTSNVFSHIVTLVPRINYLDDLAGL